MALSEIELRNEIVEESEFRRRGGQLTKRVVRKAELGSLLTITEVAEILRMHSITVYRFVKQGVIPGFKIGNAWRVNKDSLELWLSAKGPQQKAPKTRPPN